MTRRSFRFRSISTINVCYACAFIIPYGNHVVVPPVRRKVERSDGLRIQNQDGQRKSQSGRTVRLRGMQSRKRHLRSRVQSEKKRWVRNVRDTLTLNADNGTL